MLAGTEVMTAELEMVVDPDEHLVHVPLVAGLWPPPLQRIGEDPAEAQAHSRMLS